MSSEGDDRSSSSLEMLSQWFSIEKCLLGFLKYHKKKLLASTYLLLSFGWIYSSVMEAFSNYA